MEDERLADVAPAAGGRPVVEEEQEQQQEDDAAGGVHGVDDEHHDQTAEDPQEAGVPGKELEGRSDDEHVGTKKRDHKQETINITVF